MTSPVDNGDDPPRSDPPEATTGASAAPPRTDLPPVPLGRLVLAGCAAFAIMVSLLIIAAVCFRLFAGVEHPIIEALILAVIVLWAAIPLATSRQDLLLKIAFYATMLFSVLGFMAYQTIVAFWFTLAVLVVLVLIENGRRRDAEPLYTKIAQTIAVTSLIATSLRHFTEYFFPALQTTLATQFGILYQLLKLREVIALAVGSIILYATAVNTIRRFRGFEWREFGRSPAPATRSRSSFTSSPTTWVISSASSAPPS